MTTEVDRAAVVRRKEKSAEQFEFEAEAQTLGFLITETVPLLGASWDGRNL